MRGDGAQEEPDDFAEEYLSRDFADEPDDFADSGQTSDPGISATDSITYAIRDILDGQYVFALRYPLHLSLRHSYQFRVKKDGRTWRDRRRSFDENWRPLVPLLVKAYYGWRYPSGSQIDPGSPLSGGDDRQEHELQGQMEISVVDLYTLATSATITVAPNQRNAEALVAAGYLGNSPIQPSVAISLKTLELFRTLRLFKASYSAEAFAKVVCHHYRVSTLFNYLSTVLIARCIQVPYRRHFRTALADAFDIYLMMLDQVDNDVSKALGRDGPDWRAINSCPPCSYEVRGYSHFHLIGTHRRFS